MMMSHASRGQEKDFGGGGCNELRNLLFFIFLPSRR